MRIFKALNLLAVALLIGKSAFTQDYTFSDYEWEANPKLHDIELAEDEYEVILKQKKVIEFTYDQEGNLVEYSLFHKIIRVNSEEAIEKNNKIYLHTGGVMEVIAQKARVIKKNGEVQELNEDNIKESEDEENQQSFKYFAVEGVEKGSEIEYYFIKKIYPHYTGSRIGAQDEIPMYNFEYDIISPSNLVFKTKGYNDFPDFIEDTTNEEVNRLFVKMDTVPALADEEYANYSANQKYFNYKLYYNSGTGSNNIVSFSNVAKIIYSRFIGNVAKGDVKKLSKLSKKINTEYCRNERDKVRTIEEYLKTNFNLIEAGSSLLSNIPFMLKNKVCNEEGMTIMLVHICRELGIKHNIVMTSDRYDVKFDPEFETYNYLTDYLVYFPDLDEYVAPGAAFHRLGYIPYGLTYNHGLLIKEVSLGEYNTGIAKNIFIEALGYDKNRSDLFLTAEFNEDLTAIDMDVRQEMEGYYAQYYQPAFNYIDAEDEKEITEGLIKNIHEDVEIEEYNVINEGSAFFGIEPFIVESKASSDYFVENANDKILFKVGELIGPQMEMYQEDERKMEVENRHNHKYTREIVVIIPDGYTVKNLEDIKINKVYTKEGKETMGFVSDYKFEENKLTISVYEYYDEIIVPVEKYKEFQTVINAAADFNKVVLLIEK